MTDHPYHRDPSQPILLLVDDSPLVLMMLKKHLEGEGFQIATAGNGVEAIRTMGELSPDIIITDWDMPQCNGIELCKTVRSEDQFGSVFIIILTAHTGEDHLVEAFDAGADDYLTKKFTKKELLARMRPAMRIVTLERELEKKTLEAQHFNAKLEVANHELEKANFNLTQLSILDELTGLLNRRAAMRDLKAAWASSDSEDHSLACIAFDIDHFKKFNDRHGHAVGDLVLRSVSKTLLQMMPPGRSLYRVGGEEFLVICPDCELDEAGAFADSLRATTESLELDHDGDALHVKISLGVARREPDMGTIDDLLNEADRALYEAKNTGRNKVCLAQSSMQEAPKPIFRRAS